MTIDFSAFDTMTFDCYGTLIDWERGIVDAFAPIFDGTRASPSADELLEAYARHESDIEAGAYRSYREVLAGAARAVAADFGVEPTSNEIVAFSESVPTWPAFPDSAGALDRLGARYRLVALTNCDDDLFAASNAQLGGPFTTAITAQQVRSYKPGHAHFEAAFAELGTPRERIVHVAQSLYHDHVPAHDLGLTSVWVNRRGDRRGEGATRAAATAAPTMEVPDMATLARLAVSPS